MFKIMTKKDKRIKELEDQIRCMYYKHPTIIQSSNNVIVLGAKAIIDNAEIPTELYKREIAQQMMQEVERHIHYDIEDINGKKVIKGYLRVVAKTI